MDNSKSRQNENLGVNKMGKNIRKSPLHQPNFGNNNVGAGAGARQQQPQPQVYNISKNDFRNVVQQLTGSPSPSQDPPPPPRPQQNSPKPQSMRLQKIRPPPLTPINRPPMRPPMPSVPSGPPPQVPYNNNTLPRPPPPHAQFGMLSPNPLHPGDMTWGSNTAESPISAYMRYLQHSMMDPGSRGNNQVQPQAQGLGNNVQPHHPPSSPAALLPNPNVPLMPSPRFNGPVPVPPVNNVTNIPSPHTNGPPILPSPTSQFILPSPTGYMNFLSPQSGYPPLSPGFFPSPFTPGFPFSPFAQQSGILGPGPQPQPPLSPGLFPLSPSAFFPIASPRWREP